MALGNMF